MIVPDLGLMDSFRPKVRVVTLVTGFPSNMPLHEAEAVVLDVLSDYQEAATVTDGKGYHWKWGVEPVVVVTMVDPTEWCDRVARDIRHKLNQDAVLLIEHDARAQLVAKGD